MEKKKKTIIVSIMGRLVKKTPSRHYWLYDGKKWVRLGLARIANELKVSAGVIKAAIYVEGKKDGATVTEKSVKKGFKYWFDSVDIAFLAFFVVLSVILMGLAYGTNDVIIISLCTGFTILMDLCVGMLTIDNYRATVKFSKGGATA